MLEQLVGLGDGPIGDVRLVVHAASVGHSVDAAGDEGPVGPRIDTPEPEAVVIQRHGTHSRLG